MTFLIFGGKSPRRHIRDEIMAISGAYILSCRDNGACIESLDPSSLHPSITGRCKTKPGAAQYWPDSFDHPAAIIHDAMIIVDTSMFDDTMTIIIHTWYSVVGRFTSTGPGMYAETALVSMIMTHRSLLSSSTVNLELLSRNHHTKLWSIY